MKLLSTIVLLFFISFNLLAQQNTNEIGAVADVKIELIDKVMTVNRSDLRNSRVRFKIVNNSTDSIYVPYPKSTCGTMPHFFDLKNAKRGCIFEDCEIKIRSLEEYVLIGPKSSHDFTLPTTFYMFSCVGSWEAKTALLTFESDKSDESFWVDSFKSESAKKVLSKLLYTTLEPKSIEIIYQ